MNTNKFNLWFALFMFFVAICLHILSCFIVYKSDSVSFFYNSWGTAVGTTLCVYALLNTLVISVSGGYIRSKAKLTQGKDRQKLVMFYFMITWGLPFGFFLYVQNMPSTTVSVLMLLLTLLLGLVTGLLGGYLWWKVISKKVKD